MTCFAALYLFMAHFFSCVIVCRQENANNKPRDHSTASESSRRFRAEFLEDWPQTSGAPYFDPSTPDNVTGLVGHPVTLLCKVKNLQNRTVSWVRHRDIHLLTVGRYTYTSDQRFEAQHKPRSEEWALRIRSPQRRDSGSYECQISTTPPIGHAVFLNIVEPETEILGGPDLFIYAGSTINLTCIIRHTPEPPSTINWTHRGKTINFDSTRGGISLVTEKGTHSTSRLLVQSARTTDAGSYQCAPDNAHAAVARLHVLTEKQLRKKWKNLRDQFRKEKKKCPTPRSGDGGDEIEITWPYFQFMQFLNDDITPEVMTGNLHDSDSESLNNFSNTEEQSNIANVTSPGTSTCSSRTNASKRNKTASDYRDELIEFERKKILLIEQKIASNNDQPEKCDDYHFFMSLMPQMKQFSELQKLRIRNKITQIIIDEAERMQFSCHQRYEENYGGCSTGNYNNY